MPGNRTAMMALASRRYSAVSDPERDLMKDSIKHETRRQYRGP
jgi:hypothetical protein